MMTSPLHRENILNRHFKEAGVGFSLGIPWSTIPLGGVYTIDFGMLKR
jgi:uncharacterized protein YkwD